MNLSNNRKTNAKTNSKNNAHTRSSLNLQISATLSNEFTRRVLKIREPRTFLSGKRLLQKQLKEIKLHFCQKIPESGHQTHFRRLTRHS